MTQLAREYHLSRTLLYQRMWAAQHQLEQLFSDSNDLVVHDPHPFFEPLLLLLRLEGRCSIPSISSICKYFHYQPGSVGSLRERFHTYGRVLPSTLQMAESTVVFYLTIPSPEWR
jgi:hypothetical protein